MSQPHTMIETLAGQLFRVTETADPHTAHVWNGVEVKRVKGGFADKAKARSILVRKLGTRIVASAQQAA